jgi:hypothetical protein
MIRELMAMEDAMALEESLRKARSRMDAAILGRDFPFKSFSSKTEQIFNILILRRAEIIWNSKFGLSVPDIKVSGGKIPQTNHLILKSLKLSSQQG